jgi:hypothetical protein
MKRGLLIVFFILLIVSNSWADFELDWYQNQYKKNSDIPEARTQMESYLTGVGRGIHYANTMLQVSGREKLFCIPENLSLDAGIIQSLLDQEIRYGKYKGETYLEAILMMSFIHRFPCKR